MAKKPTITTVASGFQSTATINNNFQNLRDAFDNTLSLDGSTPNAMNADLDMNGNDIINVGSANGNAIITVNTGDARYVNTSGDTMTGSLNTPALYTNGLYINGNPVLPSTLTYNGIVKESKVSTSGQTVFNLSGISYTPGINNLSVYVDGVYQKPSNYTETSATVVTFSVGLHVGAIVDFVVLGINTLSGTADAVNLTYTAPGSGAVSRTVYSKFSETVSIKDFGATGNGNVTVDTAALQAAIASGGRAVFFPKGTYIINFVNLPANTMLWGEGAASVIVTPPGVRCAIGADSGSSTATIDNIVIKNLRLEGRVVQDGFAEQQHISSWNGVKNLLIEGCQFIGFQGDGVYLGTGNAGGLIRVNENVIIQDCFFDGVNKDNRNAISITACNGLLIEGCYFTRSTRSNMPGPIDVEPDGNISIVIKDIKIVNNRFYDTGGNVAAISIFLSNADLYTTPAQGFLISGNFIENASLTGILYYQGMTSGATNAMPDQAARIVNNVTFNTGKSIEIFNAKGALVEGNQFIRGAAGSLIGFTGSTAKSIDLTLTNNQFIESGYVSGNGFVIFNAERLTFDGNLFKDCSIPSAGSGNAITFGTNSSSSYVKFINNTIVSPDGQTLIAIQKEATHTFAPETNSFRNNTITISGNNFQSYDNDTQEIIYAPIVTGSTSSGTGAYSLQYGRWRRLGKIVFFRLKLTVDAGHTGTGMIQVSLPTLAASASNNEETTIAISVTGTGVSTTGGQIGLINPAVTIGSAGAIRLYHSATGTLAQTTIPTSGAFTITASGFYQES